MLLWSLPPFTTTDSHHQEFPSTRHVSGDDFPYKNPWFAKHPQHFAIVFDEKTSGLQYLCLVDSDSSIGWWTNPQSMKGSSIPRHQPTEVSCSHCEKSASCSTSAFVRCFRRCFRHLCSRRRGRSIHLERNGAVVPWMMLGGITTLGWYRELENHQSSEVWCFFCQFSRAFCTSL